MEIEINEQRRKTKLVGIRLYKEEYDLISAIAKKKNASRSFVAESCTHSTSAGFLHHENITKDSLG